MCDSKIEPTKFETLEPGTSYELPTYRVTEDGLKESGIPQVIQFVRGSKDPDDCIENRGGILHESLLAMQIEDLKHKNNLVPSRETSLVITKLEEALHWMQARQHRRKKEGTRGTYKK